AVTLLTLRPRAGAALFPYTTLFRSKVGCWHRHECRDQPPCPGANGRSGAPARGPANWDREYSNDLFVLSSSGVPPLKKPAASGPDRKSTRLNSSHVKISYAVFCLKK